MASLCTATDRRGTEAPPQSWGWGWDSRERDTAKLGENIVVQCAVSVAHDPVSRLHGDLGLRGVDHKAREALALSNNDMSAALQ